MTKHRLAPLLAALAGSIVLLVALLVARHLPTAPRPALAAPDSSGGSGGSGYTLAQTGTCTASLDLLAAPASPIAVGETYAFTASLQNEDGTPREESGVAVSFSKQGVGTFGTTTTTDTNASGQATGVTLTSDEAGTVTVTAELADCTTPPSDTVELEFESAESGGELALYLPLVQN